MTHEVVLHGYNVKPGSLQLGTFDSYGIEKIHVTADDEWAGLDILAVFHAPDGTATKVVVGANGMLAVPPEATAKQAGVGRIVFVGLAENVQRITVDMGYNIKPHSDIEGDNPGTPTPDVVQQILENSNHAVSIATAAQEDAENARQDAEDAAKKAGEGAGGAAASAAAAKKSAEDADNTANSIKDSMTQISENKEAVSQLKEDTAALQKRQNVLVGSETGNPVSCNDAFAAPLCGLTIYGKSTQVSTTGAQLISLNDSYGVTTINGVTKTPIGISAWKLEGIAKENTTIYPYSSAAFLSLSKGDYVFSVFGTSKARARYVIIGGTSSEYIQTGRSLKISLQEDVKLVFNFIIENGVESDGILMIMLNSGSASLPWEPYTGGEPSPSPNYPQEIESAGDGGSVVVKVSDGNGKEQALTLQTPTGLPGIPVTSGGNYTDQNGQQWVCDEVDLERGVKVQRVTTIVFSDQKKFTLRTTSTSTKFRFSAAADGLKTANLTTADSSAFCSALALGKKGSTWTIPNTFTIDADVRLYVRFENINSLDELRQYLQRTPMSLTAILATPIETPLTSAEIAAYKALTAYAPDTVVQASDGADVKLEYQRDVNIAIKNLEDAIASMTTT